MIVVAAYDVSEDARRARLAALLQTYGDRVQRSVFVLSVDDDLLQELRARVPGIIDVERDSFYVFRQCAGCWESIEVHGQANHAGPVLYWTAM